VLSIALAALGVVAVDTRAAHADVTTISQDTYRTGWDQNEPGLAPAQVTSSDFGQQFSTAVDGQVYATPVVVGGTLVVGTETNHVYGIDPATGAVKWTDTYGAPWPASGVTQPGNTWSCGDLAPYIGITSTPVYDPASGYVYLTSKEDGGTYHEAPVWKMHAVDPATGAEKAGFPVVIGGSPSNDSSSVFNPVDEGQRPGLLLLGGVVYAAFGSVCDHGNWRGYVAGVSTGGTQTALWVDETGTANKGGGIWDSGGGLVADSSGHIEFATGNGIAPPVGPGNAPPATMSESVVSLTVRSDGSLAASDFFSPSDAPTLDQNDRDLGSGGVLAIPDAYGTSSVPHLAVVEGKDGRIFLLNRDNLGGRGQGSGGGDADVQTLGPYNGCYCHPAFAATGGTGYVYYSGNGGPLQAFKLGTDGSGNPALALVGQGSVNFGYLAEGSPVVTSSGTTAGSSVVWVERSSDMYGNNGTLYAYNGTPNADGSLTLLWSGPIGVAPKFVTPATSNGRVYIGTRDGHLLAFGRPAASALTGSPVDLGKVNVGSQSTGTLTVTATKALNVTAVTTSAPFSVTAPALPHAMASGDTLAIPVAFAPTAAGASSGIVTIATDAGTIGFSLTGTGVKAGFATSPGSVSFTNQPTSVPISTSVQFTNTGTGSETISSTSTLTAPWSATGAPAAGTVVAPGGSFIENVTYSPTTAGSSSETLSVTSTSGTFSVPLSGTAVTGQGHLTITPTSLNFGSVPVGTTSSQLSFTVTNDGNIPVTLNKAKAPVGVFSSPNAVAEGTVVGPGQSVVVPVVFSPTTAGAASDSYEITGNTGQGDLYVQLTGTGLATLPAPPTGWTVNGSATQSSGAIQLTPATAQQSGSAFYNGAVATDGLTATFTAQENGGTGGDGMTFAMVDSTKGSTTATGSAGGGMGFSGLPGLAVVLANSWNGQTGMGNFVGIAAGPNTGVDNLTYLAYAAAPSPLRTGTHQVTVTVAGGHVKVSVDGAQLLDYVPATGVIPSNAYVGFTGSTGASTDVHAVSGLTITPPAAKTGPQPLTPTPSVVAFGSQTVGTTGSQSVTLMNNGTATETVTAVSAPSAPFGATLPSVGATVAVGAGITVPVTFAPTVTGAQNGSFSVTTTSGTVTVSLTGTGQPATAGGTLPGFTDSSWHLNGVAADNAGVVSLTTDGMKSAKGTIVNSQAVSPIGLHATFTEQISGSSTAQGDGLTLSLLDASSNTTSALGHNGSGLGVTGLNAVVTGLCVFSNFGTTAPVVGVATTSSSTTTFTTLARTNAVPALQGATHQVDVTVTAASHLVVKIDGTQVLDVAATLPSKVLVAFTAATGASTDTFAVSSPTITYTS
jgi:hypothetical protein